MWEGTGVRGCVRWCAHWCGSGRSSRKYTQETHLQLYWRKSLNCSAVHRCLPWNRSHSRCVLSDLLKSDQISSSHSTAITNLWGIERLKINVLWVYFDFNHLDYLNTWKTDNLINLEHAPSRKDLDYLKRSMSTVLMPLKPPPSFTFS